MLRRLLPAALAAAAVALAISGCVPNHPAGSGASAVRVDVADDRCDVSASTTPSGSIAFSVHNTGTDVNEFEVLAEDRIRIVGEKENVTPGQKVSLVVQLQPGRYFTACRFQQVGDLVGMADFTVTGNRLVSTASEKRRISEAVTNYVAYIRSQTEQLVPAVAEFSAAYARGDDTRARTLFASTRLFYERIEPTAEAFGELDPKLDYREVDAAADGLDWTGFHRMEKDLWPPAPGALNSDGAPADQGWAASTPAERSKHADALLKNTQQLYDLVHATTFSVGIADISNGAIALLDEVAKNKITGEEDWWSHTDLVDFAGNVEGAKVAFDNVKDIAASKSAAGASTVRRVEARFAALTDLLDQYGSTDAGFVAYDQVTGAQRKELSDGVNALAEPLSQLTHSVLGVSTAR